MKQALHTATDRANPSPRGCGHGTARSRGFTLVEMLIVILVIGILAMVVIPMISDVTGDAKLATLQTNLETLRRAVTIYHSHHNGTYPGIFPVSASGTGGVATPDDGSEIELQEPGRIFAAQLTLYTDAYGNVSKAKTDRYKHGPYVRGAIPVNPFNDNNAVSVDLATTSIMARQSDKRTGWKFYAQTGVLIANDGAHDDL